MKASNMATSGPRCGRKPRTRRVTSSGAPLQKGSLDRAIGILPFTAEPERFPNEHWHEAHLESLRCSEAVWDSQFRFISEP